MCSTNYRSKKVYEGTQLRKVTEGTLDAVVSLEYALAWLLGPKGLYRTSPWAQSKILYRIKPVLNWAHVCLPEHTSDTSTNYDSFLR